MDHSRAWQQTLKMSGIKRGVWESSLRTGLGSGCVDCSKNKQRPAGKWPVRLARRKGWQGGRKDQEALIKGMDTKRAEPVKERGHLTLIELHKSTLDDSG